MADTPNGETVTPGDSQTTVQTPAPATGNVDTAEVERLRKEKEQSDMRVRQLENERQARETADREAEAKRLKENEEYKQLYERSNAELEKLRTDREAEELRAKTTQATADVFKDYPEAVQQVAKTTGLTLSDDSEAARLALKEKLDSLQKVVGGTTPQVESTNPATTTPAQTTEPVTLGHPRSLGEDNGQVQVTDNSKAKFSEYLKTVPAIEQMRKQAQGQ